MSTLLLDDAQVKAAQDAHMIEFYAAAFSKKPDKVGDIIDPHAFDDWLKTFYDAGKPLPVSFAHDAVMAKDQTDAMTEMIGYAPATPDHVFVDDYGLRVRAVLFDEEKANRVYERAKAGLIPSASFAYNAAREKPRADGATVITKVTDVGEVGPCLIAINEDAYLIGVKAAIGVHHTETYDAAWDGPATEAKIPDDATGEQLLRVFAFKDPEGDPAAKASYSFLHHSWDGGPGPANVKACISTIGILNGGRGVNPSSTRWGDARPGIYSHVAAHLRDAKLEPAELKALFDALMASFEQDLETKHMQAPAHLQSAHDSLVKAGAKCAPVEAKSSSDDETDAEEQPSFKATHLETDDLLARLRLIGAEAL